MQPPPWLSCTGYLSNFMVPERASGYNCLSNTKSTARKAVPFEIRYKSSLFYCGKIQIIVFVDRFHMFAIRADIHFSTVDLQMRSTNRTGKIGDFNSDFFIAHDGYLLVIIVKNIVDLFLIVKSCRLPLIPKNKGFCLYNLPKLLSGMKHFQFSCRSFKLPASPYFMRVCGDELLFVLND